VQTNTTFQTEAIRILMQAEAGQWVDELATRYGPMVFAAAFRVLGNADDAEDVLQGVFLKLLDHSSPPQDVLNWGGWLRVSATRRAIDVLRQRARYREESIDNLPDFSLPTHSNVREQIDSRRAAQQLRQALTHLPERDARIFALRYFEELSYEEISTAEGVSLSLVGVSIHRTRKQLCQRLQSPTPAASHGEKQ